MKNIAKVKIFHNFKKPQKAGTYHYLICLTGANKGISYYLFSKRVVMGRSEKADIQIIDAKSSREHAELTFVSDRYYVTDLGSHNGMMVNDLKITQHQLEPNDNIIIGQTVYKYSTLLVEETALEVADDDDDDDDDVHEIESFTDKDTKKKSDKVDPNAKRKKLMLAAVGMMLLVFLLPTDSEKKKEPVQAQQPTLDTMRIEAPLVSDIEDRDVRDKLSAFIHRGQREYREGNYFRAIEQFEMALILVPNHGQASFYLQKTQDSLRSYIDGLEKRAEQKTASLKYLGALNQYCAIISFLQNYPDDERYVKALQSIAVLEDKLGMEKGEFKCL